MQVTNHSNNTRTMKEEMLEAIYGTVERLEQKVDELSASPKNAGAETVLSPASVDTSKLEKAILSVLYKNSVERIAFPRNFCTAQKGWLFQVCLCQHLQG